MLLRCCWCSIIAPLVAAAAAAPAPPSDVDIIGCLHKFIMLNYDISREIERENLASIEWIMVWVCTTSRSVLG